MKKAEQLGPPRAAQGGAASFGTISLRGVLGGGTAWVKRTKAPQDGDPGTREGPWGRQQPDSQVGKRKVPNGWAHSGSGSGVTVTRL